MNGPTKDLIAILACMAIGVALLLLGTVALIETVWP